VIRGARSGFARSANYRLEPETAAEGNLGGAVSLLATASDSPLRIGR